MRAAETHRGRIIAVFGVVVSAGFALGPLILSMTGADGWAPFLVTIALLLVAAAVLAGALGSSPKLEGPTSGTLARYVLLAPVAAFGYFVFAAGDAMLLTFLPIYAVGVGVGETHAIRLLTVLALGSMAFQYPIGWLADRVSNHALAAAMGAALLAGSALLPWAIPHPEARGRRRLHVRLRRGARGALHLVPDTRRPAVPGRRPRRRLRDARGHVLHRLVSSGRRSAGAAMDRFGADAMPVSLVIAYALFLAVIAAARLRRPAPAAPRA